MQGIRVIPVIDLKEGVAVHAKAGRRAEYRPVRSALAESADPLELAAAFRDQLGLTELYVADLDAIAGGHLRADRLADLQELGLRLMVDAGVAGRNRAEQLLSIGVPSIVAGLETLPGPELLEELLSVTGPDRLVFSLDLNDGQPLGRRAAWEYAPALEIACRAIGIGVRRLIVLDLAFVGSSSGGGTMSLCKAIRERARSVELITGGGVRSASDLVGMQTRGINGALVGTALHNGKISRTDLDRLRSERVNIQNHGR